MHAPPVSPLSPVCSCIHATTKTANGKYEKSMIKTVPAAARGARRLLRRRGILIRNLVVIHEILRDVVLPGGGARFVSETGRRFLVQGRRRSTEVVAERKAAAGAHVGVVRAGWHSPDGWLGAVVSHHEMGHAARVAFRVDLDLAWKGQRGKNNRPKLDYNYKRTKKLRILIIKNKNVFDFARSTHLIIKISLEKDSVNLIL